VNHHLGKIELNAKNIRDDLMDGFFLAMLIEAVTGKSLGSYHSRLFAYDLFMIFTIFVVYFFHGFPLFISVTKLLMRILLLKRIKNSLLIGF
jgi:hypothetical protein